MNSIRQNSVAKYYQNKAEIDRLKAEYDEAIKPFETENQKLYNEVLADLTPDRYAVGPFKITVSPNRRFDATKAKTELTESQFRKVSKRVADKKLIEAHYPEKVESCYKEFAPKVKVEMPDA